MYMTKLYPKPASFAEQEGEPFRFGAKVRILVPKSLSADVCGNLARLWKRFSFDASTAEIAPVLDAWQIVVGNASPIDAGEYYAIRVDGAGASVAAVSEKALIDGFNTLVQLITPECLDEGREALSITPADVCDKPSMGVRMIHLCVFPESRIATIEKAIHMAGFLKLTHVVLEFWGMLKYDCFPALGWKQAFTKAQVKPLIDLAHSYGMEVIPMINHFGHATQSRIGMGRHTVLNENPRLQMYFEPDGWTWCTTNPDTYKLLSEIRAELMELCGDGSYFHLGFDEAYSFATCPECRKHDPAELLAGYINNLTADLAKDGRRPIIWHDELVRREAFRELTDEFVEANGQNHGTDAALDLLDRRVIIADWNYSCKKGNPTTPYFIGKGFDVLTCPWDNLENIQCHANVARESGALGVMLTTWDHLPDFLNRLPIAAAQLWSGEILPRVPAYLTETASILRKLYDTDEYVDMGWLNREVNG
ncbi:MAG: family 20 glycosylhydrolase [Clostridia bacterium]|nr:family 20 glycosylhydrolase [Clostridia bacterium]